VWRVLIEVERIELRLPVEAESKTDPVTLHACEGLLRFPLNANGKAIFGGIRAVITGIPRKWFTGGPIQEINGEPTAARGGPIDVYDQMRAGGIAHHHGRSDDRTARLARPMRHGRRARSALKPVPGGRFCAGQEVHSQSLPQ